MPWITKNKRSRFVCNPNYGDLITALVMLIAFVIVALKDYLLIMFLLNAVLLLLATLYILKRRSFVFYDSHCEIKRFQQKDSLKVEYSDLKEIKMVKSSYRGGHKIKIYFYKDDVLKRLSYVVPVFPEHKEIEFLKSKNVKVSFY